MKDLKKEASGISAEMGAISEGIQRIESEQNNLTRELAQLNDKLPDVLAAHLLKEIGPEGVDSLKKQIGKTKDRLEDIALTKAGLNKRHTDVLQRHGDVQRRIAKHEATIKYEDLKEKAKAVDMNSLDEFTTQLKNDLITYGGLAGVQEEARKFAGKQAGRIEGLRRQKMFG